MFTECKGQKKIRYRFTLYIMDRIGIVPITDLDHLLKEDYPMKNKIVSFLACLIALSILLFPVSAFADSDDVDFIEFEPRFTKLGELSASKWYSTSDNRALLTALIIIDLVLAFQSNSPDIPDATKTSIVGKDDFNLNILLQTSNGTMILVVYTPELETASYYITSQDFPETMMELLASSICSDGYEKNDTSQVVTNLSALLDALLENN